MDKTAVEKGKKRNKAQWKKRNPLKQKQSPVDNFIKNEKSDKQTTGDFLWKSFLAGQKRGSFTEK